MLSLLGIAWGQSAGSASQGANADIESHFVSLTPHLLDEVQSSDYVDNPAGLDGAQLFYAPQVENGKVPDLLGAQIKIVHPYRVKYKEENAQIHWECVWGCLDYFSAYKGNPTFWCRPSSSFYAISHAGLKIKGRDRALAHIDFTKWKKFHPYGNVQPEIYQQILEKPPVKDFSKCPWVAMLDRKYGEEEYQVISTWVDKKLPQKLNSIEAELGEFWPLEWEMFDKLRNKGIKIAKESRKKNDLNWGKEFQKAINESKNQYDGFLYLHSSSRLKDSFFKISNKSKKKAAPPSFHLLPFSAKVRLTKTAQNHLNDKYWAIVEEQDKGTLLKAVVLAEVKQNKEFYILAITSDWKDGPQDAATPDGITVTQQFQPTDQTHAQDLQNRVIRAEFSNIKHRQGQRGSEKEEPTYYTIVSGEGNQWHYKWTDGCNKIQGFCRKPEQSPIALKARASGVTFRVLVAVRQDLGDSWPLKAEKDALGRSEVLDTGTYYEYTKENLADNLNQVERKQEESKTKKERAIKLASGIKISGHTSLYDIYEVDMQMENSLPDKIRYCKMRNKWSLHRLKHDKHGNEVIEENPTDYAYTTLKDVYLIFDDSTWRKDGLIDGSVNIEGAVDEHPVLVWEDALKAMCKEVYANNNPQKSAIQEAISTALYSLTTYHPVLKWNNLDNVLHKGKSYLGSFYSLQRDKTYSLPISDMPTPFSGKEFVLDIERMVLHLTDFETKSASNQTKRGDNDPKVICADVACLSAVLPRICGIEKDKTLCIAKAPNHVFNVYKSTIYDSTPPLHNSTRKRWIDPRSDFGSSYTGNGILPCMIKLESFTPKEKASTQK